MYKFLNEGAPAYLSQKFKKRSQIHSRTTRNRNELDLIKCRLATGQWSFSFRGAKAWNELPKSIRDATSLNTFKTNLMKLFKETFKEFNFLNSNCTVYKVFASFIISYFYVHVDFYIIVGNSWSLLYFFLLHCGWKAPLGELQWCMYLCMQCPRTNILAYFRAKWRLLFIYSRSLRRIIDLV